MLNFLCRLIISVFCALAHETRRRRRFFIMNH